MASTGRLLPLGGERADIYSYYKKGELLKIFSLRTPCIILV